jgi:hypothetical protein
MRPKFYYNDRWRLGTLSGSEDGALNPVERVADSSIGLAYIATSGGTAPGVIETVMPSGVTVNPTHFVMARSTDLDDCRLIVESEDPNGGNNAVRLDVTISATTTSGVWTLSGGTARAVWRLTLSGTGAGSPAVSVYEMQLADEPIMPRSNEVGVSRDWLRQFRRQAIPGGEPFVVREGPRLRRTQYQFVVISGAELTSLQSFVEDIEGGQAFFHVDDLGQEYWAELGTQTQPFRDEAGVYAVAMTVLEVAVD